MGKNIRISNLLKNKKYCRASLNVVNRKIFNQESDYWNFISILEDYSVCHDDLNIVAYCLDENFIELIIQSKNAKIAFNEILSTYNKYLEKNYSYKVDLGKCNFKSISSSKLLFESRELHRRKENYDQCRFSSIRAYLYDDTPNWLTKKHIVDSYGSALEYAKFCDSPDIV